MTDWTNTIQTGDCFEVLGELPAESVHAVVTDPPYGLAFMGRDWDDFDPTEYQEWCGDWATEAKRVLKPGGHLLAFSGNRTHHRLFSGVEDAGYEVRDTLTWHQAEGFPKALDVSKAIDKQADAEREVVGEKRAGIARKGRSNNEVFHDTIDEDQKHIPVTAPATDAAETWDGWKTALKPATEFIVLARKPLSEGTVAENVQEWGTGALNIDGCRIESDGSHKRPYQPTNTEREIYGEQDGFEPTNAEGRYPSNVVFDEQAAERLDREVGELAESYQETSKRGYVSRIYGDKDTEAGGADGYTGSGGPSRYFYTSKASRAERTLDGRIANAHPTVKPQDLMEWLVRLATREGQTVLDPFAGSGTTCAAAKGLGREFVGIERQPEWADVARVRVGLTPEDPARVRDDDDQQGLEAFADGGASDE
jgi:DNA modification methylase